MCTVTWYQAGMDFVHYGGRRPQQPCEDGGRAPRPNERVLMHRVLSLCRELHSSRAGRTFGHAARQRRVPFLVFAGAAAFASFPVFAGFAAFAVLATATARAAHSPSAAASSSTAIGTL